MDNIKKDFVIIGSGAAGSVLSYLLSKNGFSVALIDSADNFYSKDSVKNNLFSFTNKKPSNYTPRISGVLGGNTEIWGSKIWLISKDEFIDGDWGFDFSELEKYSKMLANHLNIDHDELTSAKR